MSKKKKQVKTVKASLHPRNKHKGRYDFAELIVSCPELKKFVALNKYDTESIDFFNPEAVKTLNKALLINQYQVESWDIPEGYLCPPIPGRADYIHHLADLLGEKNFGRIPKGQSTTCLDVGVGANCIYPIIGHTDYGWSFIGSDIDAKSIKSATAIVKFNPTLKGGIDLRLQTNNKDCFYGILQKEDIVDATLCNPPFHSSAEEAMEGSIKKQSNLTHKKVEEPVLNFAGQANELWVEGGEERFVRNMIRESKKFKSNCFWFTTLISKSSNLKSAYSTLEKVGATEVKTIPMGQGNKSSRIVAWTFLDSKEQSAWAKSRWTKS
jgi:23S rRNA (adenine1618-N6)-methyltransferase